MKQPAAAAQFDIFPPEASLCGLYWLTAFPIHRCLPPPPFLQPRFAPFGQNCHFQCEALLAAFGLLRFSLHSCNFFFPFRFFRIVDDVCMIMGRSSGLNFWAHATYLS